MAIKLKAQNKSNLRYAVYCDFQENIVYLNKAVHVREMNRKYKINYAPEFKKSPMEAISRKNKSLCKSVSF